ncbi:MULTISPECIES: ribonuclease E inhibitor RraB [unclassified Acinetobacter]|uniref:ribonuclease E inhibitor RraB n=1 Tax=unclassified Acinetobacter TaxID=196816 RepID=UPI00223461AC|nr:MULTISPECIES: ribonuclease E inhibitor RraB [unclassified Acinetobacter]
MKMAQFPDDETGDALRQFQENGFDLSHIIRIDFFVAVPSEEAGEKVANKAQQLGYEVSVEKDRVTGEWTCYCEKKMIPTYEELIKSENELDKIGKQYGGYSDGFGSCGSI